MELRDARKTFEDAELLVADVPFVIAHSFERDGRTLHVGLTNHLRRAARRGKCWKSRAMLTAFSLPHTRCTGR